MSGIFISYRRSDDPNATGRIYDRLVAEFGRAKVFKDIDSIPLGRDFRSHLNDVIGQCAVVLAIVGPRWVDAHNEAGARRLEDAEDFVRLELEAAMARDIPVVPVLVSHAPMPAIAQLPATLAALAYRQSIEVRPDPDFHNDAARLATGLRAMLDPKAAALAASTPAEPAPTPGAGAQRAPRLRLAAGLLAAAAVAIALLLVPALRHLRESSPPEIRTDILTPGRMETAGFALSPDGRKLVFVGRSGGRRQLWLRDLAATRAQLLAGTEEASFPFWSPDSRSIGFFTDNALKRIDLGGGSPHTLAPTALTRGGAWNAAGTILFSPDLYSGLMRVSASGGAVEAVTKLGPKQGSHRIPSFLPDGNRFIYTAGGDADAGGIYLGALDGRQPIRLAATTSAAVYLATGWLLWNEAGKLIGQRLDPDKGVLTGTPVTLDPETTVPAANSDLPQASASATGLLAYRPGVGETRLVWRDRAGAELGPVTGVEGGNYQAPDVPGRPTHRCTSHWRRWWRYLAAGWYAHHTLHLRPCQEQHSSPLVSRWQLDRLGRQDRLQPQAGQRGWRDRAACIHGEHRQRPGELVARRPVSLLLDQQHSQRCTHVVASPGGCTRAGRVPADALQ